VDVGWTVGLAVELAVGSAVGGVVGCSDGLDVGGAVGWAVSGGFGTEWKLWLGKEVECDSKVGSRLWKVIGPFDGPKSLIGCGDLSSLGFDDGARILGRCVPTKFKFFVGLMLSAMGDWLGFSSMVGISVSSEWGTGVGSGDSRVTRMGSVGLGKVG
jgi:hypothetical protein